LSIFAQINDKNLLSQGKEIFKFLLKGVADACIIVAVATIMRGGA
jgi:hypothetical protein